MAVLYLLFIGVGIFATITLMGRFIKEEGLVDTSIKSERLPPKETFAACMTTQDMLEPSVALDQQASSISEGSPVFLDVSGKLLQDVRKILLRLDERWPKISYAAKPVQAFLDMYHAPPLITVAGEFNSGKSTLINAMLGEKLQAMQIRPKLGCVTRLKYSNRRRIIIRHMNGEFREYELQPLRTVLVENFVHEDDIMHDVFYVQVELENSLLKQFDIVDTPGFNSGFRRHNDMTAEFIGYADVLIWVFDAERLANQPDLELFHQHTQHCQTLVVVNMVDKLKLPKHRTPESVMEQFVAEVGKNVDQIYFVTARSALAGEVGSLEGSGIQQLNEYVHYQITPNAREIKQTALLLKLDQFADHIIDVRHKLLDSVDALEGRLESYNAKMSNYEKIAGQIDESINNWDEDCRHQKNYRWFLTNMPRYFTYGSLPENVIQQGKDLADKFTPLEERRKKSGEWQKRLDEIQEDIDRKYIQVMKEYQPDGGDRKALAQSIEKWKKMVSEYNNQVIEYNRFTDELAEAWDTLLNSVGTFFQKVMMPRVEEQAQKASALLIEIDKDSQKIRAVEREYLLLLQDLKVFDQELFPRLVIMYSIAKCERTLGNFRGRIQQYERAVRLVTESIANWNEDCKAGKAWKDALLDIDRYVKGLPGASQIKRRGQDILAEFGTLETAKQKIQRSAQGLDTLNESLDQGLEQIEQKYSRYSQTYASVIDAVARRLFQRDVTKDRSRLKEMVEDWQARVAVYNDVTAEYNQYVTETKEHWDQLHTMIREFFQQDIASRLMGQMEQAAHLLAGVDEVLPLVQELERKHIAQVADTKNFDPTIFELADKINTILDSSDGKENRRSPGNYPALVQGFAKVEREELVLDWKKTYARPKLDGLIVKTTSAFSGDRSSTTHRPLEIRQLIRLS
ncbi:dynamin family protein [Acetonema longum]|uniref:Dynamin family protein n=1 Tax=Acetonema longum DSM 6540 TaxID=1009370 RepID=F7NFZ0_9FIRM|nr:dynamin family protein [Acetonema longum]EGO65053.1 Dynamin family protein [Acetonema longum DSM 6540]